MFDNIMDDLKSKDVLTDGDYRIVNNKSGMYMDVLYSATSDRSPVGVWDKTNCLNQVFHLTAKGNGEWEIASVYAKGKAVDIENINSADGARVIIYTINNTAAQRFKIEKAKNGAYFISTKASFFKKFIGVEGGRANKSDKLIQTSVADESSQWVFEKA